MPQNIVSPVVAPEVARLELSIDEVRGAEGSNFYGGGCGSFSCNCNCFAEE